MDIFGRGSDGGLVLRGRHRIRISVLDEIPPETFAAESPEELALRVHALIGDGLKER